MKIAIFSIILFFGVGYFGDRLNTQLRSHTDKKFESSIPDNSSVTVKTENNLLALAYQSKPEFARLFTFGQLPLVADFLWLRGLGDDRVTTRAQWPIGEHPAVFYDFISAVALDPAFYWAYRAGATFLSVVRNDFRGGAELLEIGNSWRKAILPTEPIELREQEWNQEWGIPVALIYHYLFPLRNLPRAAEVIAEAGAINGAPEYVRSMRSRLERPTGIYEIGENLISTLQSREANPAAKEALLETVRNLQIAKFVREMNEKWRSTSRNNPEKFLAENSRDPWGGKLSINAQGQVITSTPYEPAFGLTGFETSLASAQ